MKKIIFILLVALIAAGCVNTPKQASKRIARLIERYPTAIDSTIVTVRDTIRDTITVDRIIHDTIREKAVYTAIDGAIDSLGCGDTVIVERIKWRIHKLCTIEALMGKGIAYDTAGVRLRIWAVGNEVHFLANIINTTATETTTKGAILNYNPPFTKQNWFWAFVGACIFSIILLFIRIR